MKEESMDLLRKGYVCWLALVLLLIPLNAAGADEEDNIALTLDEVRVVAPPIIEGNELDNYAAEKTTVGEQQIEDLKCTGSGDGTSDHSRRYHFQVQHDRFIRRPEKAGAVFIRGFGSSRPGSEIKMYVDGVPMYMSVWNHPLLDLMTIDPAQSIEVYKSPQPEMFSNTFAAINLVPKQKTSEGMTTKAQAQGGELSHLCRHGGTGREVRTMGLLCGWRVSQVLRAQGRRRGPLDGRLWPVGIPNQRKLGCISVHAVGR